MTDLARRLAAVVATLAAVVWPVPGLELPSAARTAAEAVQEVFEEKVYDRCTFRLINGYVPDEGTQYVRTRQVWSEDCTFGGRNWSIRVRACFEDPEDNGPVDCSSSLMPTSDRGYAESTTKSAVARGSIHYVKIRGTTKMFSLPAPGRARGAPSPTRPGASKTPAPEAARQRPAARYGLAAALAAGGVALLALGGTGFWLLRRGRSAPGGR
jgi:hypothetical protein